MHILGKEDQDKFLAKFWTQNSNAVNLIQGLNANAIGLAVLDDDLLPEVIGGRTLSGTFTLISGSGSPTFRTWDVTAGAWQTFEWTLNNQVPASANTVSRVGFPETLKYKTLDEVIFQAAGVNMDGYVRANGASYAGAQGHLSGTVNLPIQFDGSAPTDFVEFSNGILTDAEVRAGLELVSKAYLATYVSGSAAGDVHGPSSSTDTAVASFTGTGGKTLVDNTVAKLSSDGRITALNFACVPSALAYAASTTIDFSASGMRTETLAGDVTFVSSNLAGGRAVTIRIIGDTLTRHLAFPSWKFVGGQPTVLAAGKVAILTVTSFGTTDADCIAAYSAQL